MSAGWPVCELAALSANYCMDFNDDWWVDSEGAKREPIKFWGRIAEVKFKRTALMRSCFLLGAILTME